MTQEPPSKAWIVITVAIITGTCAVIAAIVNWGTPFAERMAESYFPNTPVSNVIIVTATQSNGTNYSESTAIPATAIPKPTVSFSNNQVPCTLQLLDYRDTRSSSPLASGFQGSIGHNDNGSVKIFLSGQGETYRNYYTFSGDCTSDKKIELMKREFQSIENNIRQYVPSFRLQEPVIVQ